MTRPRYRLLRIDPDDADWLPLSPVSAETMALSVTAGESPPTVLIRHQNPYVLLGPRDRRLPDLAGGVAFLRDQGLTAFMRLGGGSAVLLDQDCVSFAVARPCRDVGAVTRNYDELTRGVRNALESLGLPVVFGAAAGSYCEGPNDLLVRGLKIAGVAQAIRQGYALVSGMVLVRQDPVDATDLLNRFYEAAGAEPSLTPAVVTSVTAEVGRPITPTEVAEAIRTGFDAGFDLEPDRFSPTERSRALALVRLRRVDP